MGEQFNSAGTLRKARVVGWGMSPERPSGSAEFGECLKAGFSEIRIPAKFQFLISVDKNQLEIAHVDPKPWGGKPLDEVLRFIYR